ncbi:oxidoreductase [Methylobacterium sp. WL12]|nr:PDR/VanB family oxidoreductase [Methylobacterium sp. WL12]TXM72677.1 oxidoreductase [Methylobacterium sp. WL12]
MTARMIMKLKVASARPTTPAVLHLRLVHPQRPELPAWDPGAHVDLRLPDGRVRQYSLCGDPADRTAYEIAVKREDAGRGGSAWAHENLLPGAVAHVSAPRNNFPLVDVASEHIFVAGGIGVTPFVAMARQLATDGRRFVLHDCAPSPEQAPLLNELRAVCGRHLREWFTSEGRRFEPAEIGPPRDGTHVYACGPQRLLDVVRAALSAAGWPDAQIHSEVFQATLDENFKPEPFDATIASTGAVLHVPADRSLLQVLRDHGLATASSCELGVCGTCTCGYRDGVVIHRDVVLPVASRQDRMTPCVSRARVSVTLDL